MTAHHTVRIELDTREDLDARLDAALGSYRPAMTRGPRGHVVVAIAVPADSVLQAVQTAVAVVAQATDATVLAVEALPTDESERRAGLTPVPRLLSVSEASSELGVSRQAVLQRIDSGSLPAIRIGSTWAVLASALSTARPPQARRRESLTEVAASWDGEGRWPDDASDPEPGPGPMPTSAPLPLPLGANVPLSPM